jgi:hypothetical protein
MVSSPSLNRNTRCFQTEGQAYDGRVIINGTPSEGKADPAQRELDQSTDTKLIAICCPNLTRHEADSSLRWLKSSVKKRLSHNFTPGLHQRRGHCVSFAGRTICWPFTGCQRSRRNSEMEVARPGGRPFGNGGGWSGVGQSCPLAAMLMVT